VSKIPERYSPLLHANPMTALVEAYRALLLGGPFPSALASLYVVALSIALFGLGLWSFRSLEGRFADNL
jgi:ABC-type polysaccharide/polyol phosphate export permease